jgi:hypothetical protein
LNPRKQLVTKTDFAKFENSWLRIPYQVSKGAQKNFLAFAERVTGVWEEYQSAFDETYFKRAIAKGILFKTLEKTVPGEDWFEGDFRAQIVTYSIAKLSSMMEEATEPCTLDWEGIWRKQGLSPALLDQSRLVARAVSRIVSSPPRGTRNVSEWCKKQDCWETVREASIPLRAGLKAELKRIRRR